MRIESAQDHGLSCQAAGMLRSGVPGSLIRLFDAANTLIGNGSGITVYLNRKILPTDTLRVVQKVGRCTSKTGYRVGARGD